MTIKPRRRWIPQIDPVSLMAIGVIIDDIPDKEMRGLVADHFAASLAGQKDFNPKRWAAGIKRKRGP